MTKNAVIIGAGQTGRGYVARYLIEKNYAITFIDTNHEVINYLQQDGRFAIHFYNKDRSPFIVKPFNAYLANDPKATQAIYHSDFVFTAVGEQNLGNVAQQLKQGLNNKTKPTVIITNENGINPANVLKKQMESLNIQAKYVVSQTAVFCSTINVYGTRLDILSQNDTYYPYDADALTEKLDLNGAVAVHHFEKFLKRKIYTYNCLAGIISYCGYLKGYEIYGEAANDPEITDIMLSLLKELNPALAQYFDISIDEQQLFAQKALQKFQDKHILDYVIKNGRDAKRKLGETERIIAPMRIIEQYGGNADILYFNAAAALCYWQELSNNGREVAMTKSPIDELCAILNVLPNSVIAQKVSNYLNQINNNRHHLNLKQIIATH